MTYALTKSLLPAFIGDFNGLYAFINNLDSIFNPINEIPESPTESLDYSNVIEWMNGASGDMDNISQDIASILSSGNYTHSQLNALYSMQSKQQALLNKVSQQISSINNTLNEYLPKLLNGINEIQSKNNEILFNIESVIISLEGIENKVDELNAVTQVSLSISQVSEAYETLKSICNNFYMLSNKMKEADLEDTAILASYVKAFEHFCRNIAVGGANDLSVYLDSIHSIIMGKGLDRTSLYKSYTEYSSYFNSSTSASTELYPLYCQMVQLQVNAYSIYAIANKFIKTPFEHLGSLLNTRLDEQKSMYYNSPYELVDFKKGLDFYSSQKKIEEVYDIKGNSSYYHRKMLIEASYDKLLLSLKINNDGSVIAYQAAVENNQYIDVDVVQGNTIDNLFNTGSSNPSSKFFSGYCHAENPNEYIRAIGIDDDKIFISVGSLDKDGNYKDPNVDRLVYLTIEEEHEMESKYQIGLPVDIRDKYISLLTGFKLGIDTRGHVSLSLMNDVHSDSFQLESGKREHLPFWKNPDYHIIVKDWYFSGGSFLSYGAATACDSGFDLNGNEYMWFEVDKYNARLDISFLPDGEYSYIRFEGTALSEEIVIVPFVRLYDHNKGDVGEPMRNSNKFILPFQKNYKETMILTYGFYVYDTGTSDCIATYEGLNDDGSHGDVLHIARH